MSESESVLVLLARLEGKLDAALAGAEMLKETSSDHETRIRVLESKQTVTPKFLWSSLIGGITLMLMLLNLFDYLRDAVIK